GRVRGAPGVHVDGSRAQERGQLVGVGDVPRPDAGGEAVLGGVGAPRDLLDVLVWLRDQYGAEDLLPHDLRVVVGGAEQRRLDEVAAVAEVGRAAGDELGLGLAGVDVAAPAVVLLGAAQ